MQQKRFFVVSGILCSLFFGIIETSILKKPEITSLRIDSDVKYRFATTKVTSRVKNKNIRESAEAFFDVTLPNEAFITNLTLDIDGRIVVGEVKEKEKAKREYQEAKARGQSAGYVGTKNRETNRFTLSVTVAAGGKISFNLTYQELLKRKHGHYEQVIYIDPGQPVENMSVRVAILESRNITMLRVPPLRNDIEENVQDISAITLISRPSSKEAVVEFAPTVDFQKSQSLNGMAGQFVLQYDVERSNDAGDLLLVNGYFVHFFAPEGIQPIPSDVLFILDVSGSMSGTKIQQLKSAMRSILDQLHEQDRFNIMTFSAATRFWKQEMMKKSDEDAREEAFAYIDTLKADGWTNIEGALTDGIDLFKASYDAYQTGELRTPIIMFLTDGEATEGVLGTEDILRNVKQGNEGSIPIFSLAFGEYADYDLVKKVAIQNNGIGRKIYEASDAAMQIAGFYNEIAVTLLSNVTFKYLDAPVQNVTKSHYMNYFNGSEVVICGKYFSADDEPVSRTTMMIEVTGSGSENQNMKIQSSNMIVITDQRLNDTVENMTHLGKYEEITEKVWAYLTIKQLLEKEKGTTNETEQQTYKQQVIKLSLRYGFVTPYTSMVVTELDTMNAAMQGEDIGEDDYDADLDPGIPIGRAISSVYRPYSSPVLSSPMRKFRMQPTASRQYASVKNFLPRVQPPSASADITAYDSYTGSRKAQIHVAKAPKPASSQFPSVPESMPVVPSALDTSDETTVDEDTDKVPVTKTETKNDNRRKKQRKGKNGKKNKHYPGRYYPLVVRFSNIKTSLCFKIPAVDREHLLYRDEAVQVIAVNGKASKGKKTKSSMTFTKILLVSGNETVSITRKSIQTRTQYDKSQYPWTLEYSKQFSPQPFVRVKLQAFDMTISAVKRPLLTVVVMRSDRAHGPVNQDGTIGRLLMGGVEGGGDSGSSMTNVFIIDGKLARAVKKTSRIRTVPECWAVKLAA